MISSGATFYLREAPRGSINSLKEDKEERNENIPSIQDLLEKYENPAEKFKQYERNKSVVEEEQSRENPLVGHEYIWVSNARHGLNEGRHPKTCDSEKISKCQKQKSNIHGRKISDHRFSDHRCSD